MLILRNDQTHVALICNRYNWVNLQYNRISKWNIRHRSLVHLSAFIPLKCDSTFFDFHITTCTPNFQCVWLSVIYVLFFDNLQRRAPVFCVDGSWCGIHLNQFNYPTWRARTLIISRTNALLLFYYTYRYDTYMARHNFGLAWIDAKLVSTYSITYIESCYLHHYFI